VTQAPPNLLPCDGRVRYFGTVFAQAEARSYLAALLSHVPWRSDEVVLFGKRIVTARKVAWYADAGRAYAYSGTVKEALPWTPELLELKAVAEIHCGSPFNSCLLNLYHNGTEGMGWHSDDEPSIVRESAIASLSFGAERRFRFKLKRDPQTTVDLTLEDGSLLEMAGSTQTHWLHSLPKSTRVTEPRVNLTFRLTT